MWLGCTLVAAERPTGDIPQSAWPEAWFQPSATAAAVGLQTFRQAPVLDELVAAGELPPVAERLPDDPVVVQPFGEIGRYGGTARLFFAGESLINVPEGVLRPGPQMRLNLSNFAAKAEYRNGARTLRIALRPGHKWSDGHPVTADDYVFWFDHVLMNEELTPVVEPRFKGARIEKHDAHSFSYHFPQPMPLFVNHLAHNSSRLVMPAHFMRRYHPDFTDPAQLEREAEELGLQDWLTYFGAVNSTTDLIPFNRPVLTAYVLVSRTSTRALLRRNPYYFKVDPAGNQLPYIDYLEVQRVDSPEIMAAMEGQRLSLGERRGVEQWIKQGRQGPLVLAVADQLFTARDFARAQVYYAAALREVPFTRRGLWAAVQWGWCVEMQGMVLTDEQRDEVRAALKQAGFLAHDPAVGASFIDFIKGQLYHLLVEHDPALLHLERAFLDEDFRRRYALSLFQALAAELVWTGRVEDAREYAHLVGGEVGQEAHFLRIVEGQRTP